MSFLYPRTISVWRTPAQVTSGDQGEIGQTQAALAELYSGIAAAVQMKKDSGAQPAHLAADVSKRVYWEILTAPGSGTGKVIESNDQIQDDLGNKYQVTGAYLTALNNWQLMCERIEA